VLLDKYRGKLIFDAIVRANNSPADVRKLSDNREGSHGNQGIQEIAVSAHVRDAGNLDGESGKELHR
jgi:hypothetical protein